MPKESGHEKRYTSYVKRLGGECLKLVPLGLIGFPDRTVFLPGGIIFFIEFKIGKNDQQRHQRKWERTLTKLGFQYYVCYSYQEALDATQRAKESFEDRR